MPKGVLAVVLHLCAVVSIGWMVAVLGEGDASFDGETRLHVDGVLGLVAIAYEVVAFGLHTRKRWAWTALVFIVLGMASPVSVGPCLIVLLLLFNSRVHDWFDPDIKRGTKEL